MAQDSRNQAQVTRIRVCDVYWRELFQLLGVDVARLDRPDVATKVDEIEEMVWRIRINKDW